MQVSDNHCGGSVVFPASVDSHELNRVVVELLNNLLNMSGNAEVA